MKKLILGLTMTAVLGSGAAWPDDAPMAVSPDQGPPPFTLSPTEEDSPALVRKKAALRLMKSAQVTHKALRRCEAGSAEAGRALGAFNSKNGNTLALVMKVIRETGGLSPEIKALLEEEVEAETAALLRRVDCLVLADQVSRSERDLYKAAELAGDYRLVRGR